MFHYPVVAPGTPTFTAILHNFYRTFMTRSSAPIYTLDGRTWREAIPATEQGSPRSGPVRGKRSGSGRWLSRSSGAIPYAIAASVLAAARRPRPVEMSAGAGVGPARGGTAPAPATAQVLCSLCAAPGQG